MSLPLVIPLVAALWEQHKGGPPDSFANARGDQSPDATAARNRINDLVKDSGVEYQPSTVPQDAYKNPASLDNLYDRIQKMDVGAVAQVHETWEAFRNKLEQGHNTFGPAMLKALRDKWTGESGEKAAQGVSDFVGKENDLVVSAQLVSEKMKLARSAVEITKPGAQPAPHATWTSDVAGWIPGPTWKLNDHRKTEANMANEHLINNVFYPAVRESDTRVPLAPQPYNPINTPDRTTPGPGPSVPGPSGPGDSGPGASGPGASGPGAKGPDATGPANGDGNRSPDHTTPTSDNPSSTDSAANPAAMTPSGYDPKSATTPSSLGDGAFGPGAGGFGPGAGSSSPDSGPISSGGREGGPGSSVPGPGVPKSVAAPAAQIGKSAAPGPSGLGGVGAVGGKGKKDEDEKTHKSKISAALVTEENGNELTGLGPYARKTIPPVLGE
jgi:hypothetical protein